MPKGYVNVSVRMNVYERLEELKVDLKFKSMSDLLAYLIKTHEDYRRLLNGIARKVGESLAH
jgi:predicted CopG family antitoxin